MVAHRAILIAGPTASGKSALALRLAGEHAVVINADSMQVYRELEILTARPLSVDMEGVQHRLYGHVAGDQAYSVGSWLRDVADVLAECRRCGALPIIVGGTGLYFKALMEGLAPIPTVPESVRDGWREKARQLGSTELHAILSARDSATAARLRSTDTQRLTRALEVLEATGRGLSEWQAQKGTPLLDEAETLRLVINLDRDTLYARADNRFDQMMASDALAEAARLAQREYPADRPIMRALGVSPLLAHHRNEMSLEQAVRDAKRDTRRYIKRQQTWMKRHMIAWKYVDAQLMKRCDHQNFTFSVDGVS